MKNDIESIIQALEYCVDVSVDDVVSMIYSRQEELQQEPPEDG